MTEIIVKDKDGKDVEIKDIQALYDAHEKAKTDIVAVRSEKKGLEDQLAGTSDEEVTKWKSRAVEMAVKQSLAEQGIKNPERIAKYLKKDDISFDENDELTGFDEKLEEVKTDFPELFDAKRRAGRQDANIHASTPATPQKSTTQTQVDALFQ